MHRAKLFFIMVIAVLGTAAMTLAQDDPVTQPPPAIAFDPVELESGGPTLVRFPSAWRTDVPENNTVTLHVFVPDNRGPHPVVLVLHYWGASDLKAETDLARRLNREGVAAALVELPYHLSRTPPGVNSGALAIRPEPKQLEATMKQAVWDIRRAVDWIHTRPEFQSNRVGMVGTSLGAIVGALAFGVEPRIQSFCSMLGGADIAGTVWKSSRLVRERNVLRKRGWTESSLRDELKSIEPARFLQANDPRPAYLISARYDTIVPQSSYQALIKALPNAQRLVLETGHYGGFLVQSTVFGSVTKFFQQTLTGQAFRAPRRLYAPTLRLGAPINLESGLQVGLGLDLWKSDEKGTAFGTLYFTPRGPQGFIGVNVGQNIAIGVSVLPRRTTLGAAWSFVL